MSQFQTSKIRKLGARDACAPSFTFNRSSCTPVFLLRQSEFDWWWFAAGPVCQRNEPLTQFSQTDVPQRFRFWNSKFVPSFYRNRRLFFSAYHQITPIILYPAFPFKAIQMLRGIPRHHLYIIKSSARYKTRTYNIHNVNVALYQLS